MIVVTGEFRLPVERRVEAVQAMERVITASRGEAGCLEYSYAEDVLEAGLFRVTERWDSREALAAHFEASNMKAWQRERTELGLSGRQVVAFTISGKESL